MWSIASGEKWWASSERTSMADTPTGHLTVERIALDSEGPCHAFGIETREHLVYALVGTMRVYANSRFLGTIGGRSAVTDPLAHVVRFPAGTLSTVTLVLEGFAADCLIASCDTVPNGATKLPYVHWNDAYTHTVGTGTHERLVTEVVTPPSFHLSCGETLNAPGTTSSWPPHASIEDVQLYQEGKTTWEECFYIVAPKPGKAVLYGIYPGNRPINETITLNNGDIVPMPLYSHMVTAAPDSFLYYFWTYCGNALQKEYRKHSTDVLTYRK
jgi:5-deoxy-glucuronate isomerase